MARIRTSIGILMYVSAFLLKVKNWFLLTLFSAIETQVFPRGANVTIEVLHRVFTHVHQEDGRLPPKLYVQLDNCWRENKNKFVFGFLSDLVWKVGLKLCN